ncbi:MAG: hypothetical protein ACC628_14910, partial [Pirellulaceae bacterium]
SSDADTLDASIRRLTATPEKPAGEEYRFRQDSNRQPPLALRLNDGSDLYMASYVGPIRQSGAVQ